MVTKRYKLLMDALQLTSIQRSNDKNKNADDDDDSNNNNNNNWVLHKYSVKNYSRSTKHST